MSTIWVTGEALMDFVPTTSPLGPAFAWRCGGSNANVAKAAAMQGARVEFIGPISADLFGERLAEDLVRHGVSLAHGERVADPTTLAFVDYQGSDARYAFFNRQSAVQLTDHARTRLDGGPGDILHAGSISLIEDPGGRNIMALVSEAAQSMTISLDPNARPGMITDRDAWRERIQALIGLAGIVKLSDEDLELLAPGSEPRAFAENLVGRGVGLAVVTLGAQGAIAATARGFAQAAGHRGPIADTVGAGDTVMGTILASLAAENRADRASLARIGPDELERLLGRAVAAAWLNCQEAGCHPPDKAAVDAFLAGG